MRRRWMEYSLLFIGLIALDWFVWVQASAVMSQAYESWSFEQGLRGRSSSLGGYLESQWNRLLGRGDSSIPEPPAPSSAPGERGVIGRVEIPRLQMSVMIREGLDSATLRSAVGHVPSTALPGRPGNVALAAHRDTYFLPLEHIQRGDHVRIQTRQGSYEYVVEATQIVTPRDVWVLKASDQPTLTLVTCFPFHYIGSAPKRFIVRAAQIGTPRISSPAPSGS